MKRAKTGLMLGAFAFILAFLTMLILVSAQYGYIDLRQGAEDVTQWITDIFGPFLSVLFGGVYGGGYLLFEKFALFVLLIAMVYVAVSKVPAFAEQKGVLWIISIIVPLLAVRFIDLAWLNTILMQYQILGIALTAILPFIIYLFFLHNVFPESTAPRKIGWIFFIAIYFGLWSTAESEIYGQVYLWTMLVALAFLLLDGTIHRWFMKERLRESGAADKWEHIAQLRKDIREAREAMAARDMPDRIGNKIIKQKQKLIDQWIKA